MRTLSGTLAATQKTVTGLLPAIALEVSDRPVEIPRWDWTQISSEGVASCHGAAALAYDGGVIRARVLTSGALQSARIAAPATDNWPAAWGTLEPGPYRTTAQASVAAMTDEATAIIAFVSADGQSLHYLVSSDSGASWGAVQTLTTEGGTSTIKGVALAGAAGYVYLAFTVDGGWAEPNDTIRAARYTTSGGWSTLRSTAGHDSVETCGTALDGAGVQVVIAGGPLGLVRHVYDWGAAAWAAAAALAPAAVGAGYTLRYPRLAVGPDGSGRYFYTWFEEWSVQLPGFRYWLTCSPYRDELGEGLVFESSRGMGIDLFCAGDYWYAVSSVQHYRAAKYAGSAAQKADLGADVVAFDLIEEGPNRPARGRIWLRNEDARYASPGSGTYAMLREGSRVALGLGYRTSAGVEKVWLPPLWVEGWAHVDDGGEGQLVLEVGDAWSYLERCRARYELTYDGMTLAQVVERLVYRVTSAAVGSVGGLSITADPFTIRPGESIGVALRRVLDRAGARLRFGTTAVSGDPGHWDAATATAVAIGSGAAGYSFGPASHPVQRAEYSARGQRVNLVEVYGSGYWDWDRDYDHMKEAGHAFLVKEADWHLDSGADVDDRAARLLDSDQRKLGGGWLEVLPHLGAELYDVVDVTASRAGLAAAARRVAGIRWRFDGRRRQVWVQRLELEAV